MRKLKIKVDVLEKLKVELRREKVKLDMMQFFVTTNFESNGKLHEILTMPSAHQYIQAIEKNTCNTSCCLAGLIPIVDTTYLTDAFRSGGLALVDFIKVSRDVISEYEDEMYSLSSPMNTWGFVFAETWNNNIEFAIERIDYVIKHKSMPPESEMEYYYRKNRKE